MPRISGDGDRGGSIPERQAGAHRFGIEALARPRTRIDGRRPPGTKDGAIWFAPRGSLRAPAISVLYPDMDKITSFGAFYVNGPPGYPFKTTTSSTAP
jgi:hypothetical protein